MGLIPSLDAMLEGAAGRPLALDAFCCAGGATRGFQNAGFYVVGVDISPQPHYCGDEFYQDDALDFISRFGSWFQLRAASPPCQAKTRAQKLMGNTHPKLIAPTRRLFQALGGPFVIENVVPDNRADDDDPLLNPHQLCGCMFPELGVYRTREFETNLDLAWPEHQPHAQKQTKMGRKPVPGERMHVVGNFSGVAEARLRMGIDWMNRNELREAIPPAYTEYIGEQVIRWI